MNNWKIVKERKFASRAPKEAISAADVQGNVVDRGEFGTRLQENASTGNLSSAS
jgi:hypothetical protein